MSINKNKKWRIDVANHFPTAGEFLIPAAVKTEWAEWQKSYYIILTLTDFAGTHSVEHLINAFSRKWITYWEKKEKAAFLHVIVM